MSTGTTRRVQWFFDFISPFAYLQWQSVKQFQRYDIAYRPILFAGLLDHYGQKGPAEIAPKRAFSYRHVLWRADQAGVGMTFPPAHPFNPLAALRLCIASGCDATAIDAIFNHVWRDGQAAESVPDLVSVAGRLGLADPEAAVAEPWVKDRLRGNFDLALECGVFGVPSLAVDGQVFWGEDATDMFVAYMDDPALFDAPRMRRLDSLPVATARRGAA